MNISISNIKSKALVALKGQWGMAVLLTFIVFLINTIVPSIFGGGPNWREPEDVPTAVDLLNTLISIALIPLSTAVLWFYLALARYEGPQISDVFTIFKDANRYFKLIGAALLVGIFVFLWSLLLLIPGIIKALSYSQTFLLLKDHPEYTVLEAITESRKRMKGYKWKYFLLNLSFIGWGILCIFTLGIGFLWLTPYLYTSTAIFYNEVIITQDGYGGEEPVV